jgi:hypothetical protein
METAIQQIFLETYLTGCVAKTLPQFVDQRIQNEKDQSGKRVFTQNTEKVTTEQLKKVHHASDVPGMDMYQEISCQAQDWHTAFQNGSATDLNCPFNNCMSCSLFFETLL